MKYDECTCFWCRKHIGEGNMAYNSLRTDTLRTMRNFCTEQHLLLFRNHMLKQQAGKKPIKPYWEMKRKD